MSTPTKLYTGIGLDPEVVEFLSELSRETERTRSWLINALIRDQAQRMQLERDAKAAEWSRYKQPVIRA